MNQEEVVSGPCDISKDYRNIVILSPDKESSQFSDFLDSPGRWITKDTRTKKWPGRKSDRHSKVGSEGNLRDVYLEVNEPILSAWFNKDRTPLPKVYRLRPRGRQVSWEFGQSDTSDSSLQSIRETKGSLLPNRSRRIRGTSFEDADEKYNTVSPKSSPMSLWGNQAKSNRPSLTDEEYSQSTFENEEAKSLSSDDIESCILMLEASEDSTAPSCEHNRGSEIDEQVSKMTAQINYLVSRLNVVEKKLAGQSTTKPTFEDSIMELGSMISGLKNEMAYRDAKLMKLWKKGSKVEQTTIARKRLASKLRKYKRGIKKTRKKASSSKKFWQKMDLENEDFGCSDTDTQSLRSEAWTSNRKTSLMSNQLSSISKLTEKQRQKKTDKQSNDQSEISCLGPLLDDQELGDTILPMPSKLGYPLQMNMDEDSSKKDAPHSPLLNQGKTKDNCTDELRQEIVKIFRSRDDIPKQKRAPFPAIDFSQSKQSVTPNCSGMSTDPDESSDEGASTISTWQTTSRLRAVSRRSKPNIKWTLKQSEPEIKISVVSSKSAVDSETTSDPHPAYQNDFTVFDTKSKNSKKSYVDLFDTKSKNSKKSYVDHSDLGYQNSTANKQLWSACNYSVYDVKKRQNADNLFNVVPFYNSSRCTMGYMKRESSESPGLHRRWSPATLTNMNKRKEKLPRGCSIKTTIATLNNIENCVFGKEHTYKEQSQLFSKPHHLTPSVSRETLLRPSNILRGGWCRTHSDINYKKNAT